MTQILSEQHCTALPQGSPPLALGDCTHLIQQISSQWQLSDDLAHISRDITFKNYYQTIAFVNAIAYIAHTEDHHPYLEVSYNRCRVFYNTHSVKGLSKNDFICAAKIDQLLE